MTTARKADTHEIREHIKRLKTQPWLGQTQAWWPNYLFRVDDIESAARILNSGRLLSRAAASATGSMISDSASPGVLEKTPDRWKTHVRLYFRPRTPTEYDSEGFRTEGDRHLGAHRPVPVVMVLDAADILTRACTGFSDGNLAAAGVKIGNDAKFLKGIPFDKVYHDGSLKKDEKRSVIFHRNAEVIIPNELDLFPLKFVFCRTQAEFETLLHLLKRETLEKWSNYIGVGTQMNLHYRRWTFVEQVVLSSKTIDFYFNPSSISPGPFHIRVDIQEHATSEVYRWEDKSYFASSNLGLDLHKLKHPERYTVSLTLDGRLAYRNSYSDYNVPF